MTFRFFVNLRTDTSGEPFRRALKGRAFLIAPNAATRRLRAVAADLRTRGSEIFADNGNFALIKRVRKEFASRARALWKRVEALETAHDRTLRTGDVPPDLRLDYRQLATDARSAADRVVAERHATRIATQLSLQPSRLVGHEDLTVAVWLSLNVEPTYTAYPHGVYRAINRTVARAASLERRRLPHELQDSYYPVASALSYDTAFDAGREFAARGLNKIAMGFGAFMADDNSSDYVAARGKTITLSDRAPTRYLRTVAVARGFWDGYKAEAGRAPTAFHFLGLGAPIMLPLVALCATGTRELSFDAMSPIKDAVEGTVYTSRPSYLKVRTRKVALRLARENRSWSCPCVACRTFLRQHPMDLAAAHRWYRNGTPREVTAEDLRPGGALFTALPLLSEPAGGPLRRDVSFARMAHNHWVIERVLANMRVAVVRRRLEAHAQSVVDAYLRSANTRYGEAIRAALNLAANGV